AEKTRQFFDDQLPAILSRTPGVQRGGISCTITIPAAGTWTFGPQPGGSGARLDAASFVELWESFGAELEAFFRNGRLQVDGDECHAVRVVAMLARAHVAPIDGPNEAFAVCGGRFHGPRVALMRGSKRELMNAFPGYGPPEEWPTRAVARYRPIEPPLPFASIG